MGVVKPILRELLTFVLASLSWSWPRWLFSILNSLSAEPLKRELVWGGCDGVRKLFIVPCLILAWGILICESSESELVMCLNGCLLGISSALMDGLPIFLPSLASSSIYSFYSVNLKYGLTMFLDPNGLPAFRLTGSWPFELSSWLSLTSDTSDSLLTGANWSGCVMFRLVIDFNMFKPAENIELSLLCVGAGGMCMTSYFPVSFVLDGSFCLLTTLRVLPLD